MLDFAMTTNLKTLYHPHFINVLVLLVCCDFVVFTAVSVKLISITPQIPYYVTDRKTKKEV